MTTRNDLLSLAERVVGASADEQRELLVEAFHLISPSPPRSWQPGSISVAILDPVHRPAIQAVTAWRQEEARFVRMLNAGAYESAALTLVSEGYLWCCGHAVIGGGDDDDGEFGAALFRHSHVSDRRDGQATAATPALALTAASLRARAAGEQP